MYYYVLQQVFRYLLNCFTFFKGAHSSADEQGTAALKAVEIDDRLGGAPVQVRVVQGKEPPHFLAIFQGKLVIYQGGLSSYFDGKQYKKIFFYRLSISRENRASCTRKLFLILLASVSARYQFARTLSNFSREIEMVCSEVSKVNGFL